MKLTEIVLSTAVLFGFTVTVNAGSMTTFMMLQSMQSNQRMIMDMQSKPQLNNKSESACSTDSECCEETKRELEQARAYKLTDIMSESDAREVHILCGFNK